MAKALTYCINKDDGMVYSRLDSEVAVPVLEYDKIGEGGDFTKPLEYKLEKMSVFALAGPTWERLKWTKKIPVPIKNQHRAFWGMKPLPMPETFKITISHTPTGRAKIRKFASMAEARKAAEAIFAATGVIVGIERASERASAPRK